MKYSKRLCIDAIISHITCYEIDVMFGGNYMASLQYSYDSRYALKNYKDVVDTYEWLSSCLKYAFSNYNDLEITSSFSFSSDNLNIGCRSIDEFKELAFGLDITPQDFFVCASESSNHRKKTLAHFWTRNNPEDVVPILELTCYDKKHLIDLKDSLDLDVSALIAKQFEKKESVPEDISAIVETTIIPQIIMNHLPANNEASGSKHRTQFFSKMFWNLIIPIAVLVLAAVLVWLLRIKMV